MDKEINIEARVERACANFTKGYNCSQSVFMAYADLFGLDEEFAAKIAAPFGGGVGRMREVCGTVSGMALCAGFITPCTAPDNKVKMANYKEVQEMAEEFRAKNHSIVCRELLGLAASQKLSPKPEERTAAYYGQRHCLQFVGDAARIVGERIAGQKQSE